MTLNQTKSLIKGILKENNKKLVSNINTNIDTKIEENVPNIENVAAFTPIGTIIAVMGNEAPANYLVCDGAIYNITDYQELANYFELQFGTKNNFGGDGITTFAVPDLRGEFLRGTGTNSHINSILEVNEGSGLAVGLHQQSTCFPWILADNNGNLDYSYKSGTTFRIYNEDRYKTGATGDKWLSIAGTNTSGGANRVVLATARPTNTSVLYCIATKNIYLDTTNNLVSSKNYYSEQEQIIGIWTDGKPLYQKTLVQVLPTIESTGTQVAFSGVPTDVDMLISAEGTGHYKSPYTHCALANQWMNNYKDVITTIIVPNTTNGSFVIQLRSNNPSLSDQTYYITIQYTKTTDTVANISQIPNLYDISRPDMWPENQEIYFGNKLYGRRFTGNMPAIATLTSGKVDLLTNGTISNITTKFVSNGGNITIRNSADAIVKVPLCCRQYTSSGTFMVNTGLHITMNESLILSIIFGENGTSGGYYSTDTDAYDIWITYIKE